MFLNQIITHFIFEVFPPNPMAKKEKQKKKPKHLAKKIRDVKQFRPKTERNRTSDLGTMDQR